MAGTGDIGPLAAKLMEQIEREHPNGTVGEVGIVVEIVYEDETHIEARTTERRAWVATALFESAVRAIRRGP